MSKKVDPLPINPYKAIQRSLGARFVPCMVSGRYLEFPLKSGGKFQGGEFIPIKLMTVGDSNQPRKICELVLTREQILAALQACESAR